MENMPRMTVDNKPIQTNAAHFAPQPPADNQQWECCVLGCTNLTDLRNTAYCTAHFYELGEVAKLFPIPASPELAEGSPLVTAAQALSDAVEQVTKHYRSSPDVDAYERVINFSYLWKMDDANIALEKILAAIKPPATSNPAADDGSAR